MAEDKIIPETTGDGPSEEVGFLASVINEIIYSPLNLVLVAIITVLVYKILRSRQQPAAAPPPEPELPRLRKDFTVAELRAFDGNQPDGRVLVAVNGSVYDVTKGKRFYGPGGPYAAFGGRDASRGLATFSVTSNDAAEWDDLSDLSAMEMESVREWEMQFKEKYILVGRLLKPGEQPTSYSDEDEDTPNESSTPTAAAAATTESTTKPASAPTTTPSSPKKTTPATTTTTSDAPSKVEEVVAAAAGGDGAKAKDE
uniref:Putative membrane associated progesterone receptor n=1 Tax=Culex tarsalis TaxID=7177 RepID=A0A1Q3F9H6_CULTA